MIRLWALMLAVIAAVYAIHPADTVEGRTRAMIAECEAMAASLDAAHDRRSARLALDALRHRHTWPSIDRIYGNDWSTNDHEWLRVWFDTQRDQSTARFVKAVLRLKKDGLLPDDSRFLPPLVRPIVEAHGGESEREAWAIIEAIRGASKRGYFGCDRSIDSDMLDELIAQRTGNPPLLAGGVDAITNPWGRRYELLAIETSRGPLPCVTSRYPCGGRELSVTFYP